MHEVRKNELVELGRRMSTTARKYFFSYVGMGSLCWIGHPMASLVVFGAPVLIVILFNTISLAKTIAALRKAHKVGRPRTNQMHVRISVLAEKFVSSECDKGMS